jgi:hypothetical protein
MRARSCVVPPDCGLHDVPPSRRGWTVPEKAGFGVERSDSEISFLISSRSRSLFIAPTARPTSLPSLKKIRAGMPMTPELLVES